MSSQLTNLKPGTVYHYRLVVTDANGTSTSGDESFTTAAGVATVRSPRVIGESLVGATLIADPGAYSGEPAPTTTVQSQAFDPGSSSWVADGTGGRHQVSTADSTRRLRVEVTADDGDGSPLTVDSAATAPAVGPMTQAPFISGTPVAGQTLTLTPGTWRTADPPTITERWQRCTNRACTDVAGATGLTYQASAADVGDSLRAVVQIVADGVPTSAPTLATPPVSAAT